MAEDTVGGGDAGQGTAGVPGARRSAAGPREHDITYADRATVERVDASAIAQPGLLRRVSWGAILAGALIALGLQVLLGLLGIAIGFSAFDPSDPSGIGEWGFGTGLYLVVTQIASLVAGGFVAARLTGIPKNTTALIHGASVWAVVTFVTAYLVLSGTASVIGGATSAIGSVVKETGQAAESVLPDDLAALPTPDLEVADLPQGVRQALRENDVSAEDLRQEVRGIYRDTISEQEQRRIAGTVRRTARDVATNPADATQEIEDAIDRIVGQGGVISDQERAQLQDSLQQRLGLSNREVQELTAEIEEVAATAQENVEEALRTARREVTEAAEATADAAASAAWTAFIASLLGLIAAALGGLAGEPNRPVLRGETDKV